MSCLVLEPLKTDVSSGIRLTMEEIERELKRKRQALDEEIRRFTTEKDAEFEAFEKEIKSHLRELRACETHSTSCDKASVVERGFSVGKPYGASSYPVSEDDQSYETNLQLPQTIPLTSALKPDIFAKQPIELQSMQQPFGKEGKEFELDALFTSSYLPLLDNTLGQPDYRKALSDHNERMSSSLDVESQAPSMERPPFSDRRLSSSPINTGRSNKKSSLRRSAGSDSTRERKRVLFSINDQVISPNASPEALRAAPSTVSVLSISGLHDLYPNHTTIAGLDAATHLASMGLWSQRLPLVTPTRNYKDLVEPTVVTPPEELGQEDLQFVTRDPLFDSDEQPLPFEEEEWQQDAPDSRSSDEEEIMATSPHVSSMPIQIRQKGTR